jgi:hypothetical protein
MIKSQREIERERKKDSQGRKEGGTIEIKRESE